MEVPLSCGIWLPSMSMSKGCEDVGPFSYSGATFKTDPKPNNALCTMSGTWLTTFCTIF